MHEVCKATRFSAKVSRFHRVQVVCSFYPNPHSNVQCEGNDAYTKCGILTSEMEITNNSLFLSFFLLLFLSPDGGHEPGAPEAHQCAGVVPEGVAVVGVEEGRQARATLVPVEVEHGLELPTVLPRRLELRQLGHRSVVQELLRLDLGHLHVPVRVAVCQHLFTDHRRHVREGLPGRRGQLVLDALRVGAVGKDVVDLGNEGT